MLPWEEAAAPKGAAAHRLGTTGIFFIMRIVCYKLTALSSQLAESKVNFTIIIADLRYARVQIYGPMQAPSSWSMIGVNPRGWGHDPESLRWESWESWNTIIFCNVQEYEMKTLSKRDDFS